MSNPFDFVNEILVGKKQLIVDETTEKDYNSFIVNRSLSYHRDCVMQANEMNRLHFTDKKMQNDFLLNSVRSYKRPFAKWIKSEKIADIECIKAYFNFSDAKAQEALVLLSKEQIQLIKEKTEIGGLVRT